MAALGDFGILILKYIQPFWEFYLDMEYLGCYAEVCTDSDESKKEKEDDQVSLNNLIARMIVKLTTIL